LMRQTVLPGQSTSSLKPDSHGKALLQPVKFPANGYELLLFGVGRGQRSMISNLPR
jgi:hypothetical protein